MFFCNPADLYTRGQVDHSELEPHNKIFLLYALIKQTHTLIWSEWIPVKERKSSDDSCPYKVCYWQRPVKNISSPRHTAVYKVLTHLKVALWAVETKISTQRRHFSSSVLNEICIMDLMYRQVAFSHHPIHCSCFVVQQALMWDPEGWRSSVE